MPRVLLSPPVFAGVFDPHLETSPERVRAALARAARVPLDDVRDLKLGPLVVAHTGELDVERSGSVAALVRGRLLDKEDLGRELGLDPQSSDAQVLAAAWRRWERDLLQRLRGFFSILAWDETDHRGLIAEDHFGVHGLYTHEEGGRLRFATHLGAALGMLPMTPGPDDGYLLPWVACQSMQDDRTPFEGVTKLGPARAIDLESGGWRRRRYWAPRYQPRVTGSRQELARALREAVASSVARRLRADRAPGVTLSGGFDSTTVAVLAAQQGATLRGYSCVFPGGYEHDESERIQVLVDELGIPSVQLSVRPSGALRVGVELWRDSGALVAGPGVVLERAMVDSAARDGVRTLLDGLGGDEVFGHSPYLLADRLRTGRWLSMGRLLRRLPFLESLSASHARRLLRELALVPAIPWTLHRRLRRRGGVERHAPSWVTGRNARRLFEIHDPWLWKRRVGGPMWWRYQAYLLTEGRADSTLSESIGARGERYGIQPASPLFDVDLIQFALDLPPELAYQRLNRPLAREALRGILPEPIRRFGGKANLAPFYFETVTGTDFRVIRSLLSNRAKVHAYADRAAVTDMTEHPPAIGDPGWVTWIATVWRLAIAEIVLQTMEDPDYPDRFLETSGASLPGAVAVSP